MSVLKDSPRLFSMVVEWVTYLLFFLIPIFFLPWTVNILDLNKQMLLILLTVVGLVAWLGQMVMTKRLAFRSGWLNVLPVAFFLVVLISAIASLGGYQTWVGQSALEYTSVLSIFMFVLLFYLLMNTAGETNVQRNVLFAVLLSAALTGLLSMLGMFNLVHLPFDFAQSRGFNTIGTPNGLMSYLSVAMFAGLAMWLVSQQGRDRVIPLGSFGTMMRILIVLVTVFNLIGLVAIDSSIFWVINIIGVLLLVAFVFIQTQEFPNPRRFALPLSVFVVSLLLLFFPTPLKVELPVVVSPNYSASWQVTKTTLSASAKNLFFGSGPGTYVYDFLAYKPVAVNNSQFWSLPFDRGLSELITTLATIGMLGGIVLLVLMIWIAIKAMSRLILEKDHEEWKMTYVMFMGWSMTFLFHLLYSSNLTMQFVLWGFTGMLAAQVMTKVWETDFTRSPRLGLSTSFAFVVVAVLVVASLFVTGGRYAAEVAFAKAVKADRAGSEIETVIADLASAVRFNRWNDTFYRNLSVAYLAQAREQIANASATAAGEPLTGEQTQLISNTVMQAINAAAQATAIEPNNVSNWAVRGMVYRDLMGFANGAEDLAAQMYSNAIRLESTSPLHRTDLGRVYLSTAERARSLKNAEDKELAESAVKKEAELLGVAEQAFNSAIQLKQDYLPAHYYLAATYERQGRLEDAAVRLAALRNNNLTDIGLGFQLSQLLIRLQRYDLAKQELERIVAINSDYSNALWYLASMYEIEEDFEKAIATVEKVVELNPENELAKDRLERMKDGELTTIIPEPIQENQEGVTDVDEGEIVEEQEEEAEE